MPDQKTKNREGQIAEVRENTPCNDKTHTSGGNAPGHVKDSLIPNKNLKFVAKGVPQKLGKPFSSEIVEPTKSHFGLAEEQWEAERPHTHFDTSFDRSFLEKSAEWKMFKESHDNLEVGTGGPSSTARIIGALGASAGVLRVRGRKNVLEGSNSKLFSQNRKLIMEKVLLKNKVERMEKLLENQKNQQSQMAENYFALIDMLAQFQNQKNSANSSRRPNPRLRRGHPPEPAQAVSAQLPRAPRQVAQGGADQLAAVSVEPVEKRQPERGVPSEGPAAQARAQAASAAAG